VRFLRAIICLLKGHQWEWRHMSLGGNESRDYLLCNRCIALQKVGE
jgi:hypothetical protein